MYNSKLSQLIDQAINDCITYGAGKADGDGLAISANWSQNEKDIEVYMTRDGRLFAEWLEKDIEEETK